MNTLQDYIEATRILLQDREPTAYRYSDDDMKLALTLAFTEAYRIRPDMFVRMDMPDFNGKPLGTPVPAPQGYQSAFIYYMAGHVQLRDEEETQDNRANVFLTKFTAQLLSTAA